LGASIDPRLEVLERDGKLTLRSRVRGEEVEGAQWLPRLEFAIHAGSEDQVSTTFDIAVRAHARLSRQFQLLRSS
jgi:hypothetical protein